MTEPQNSTTEISVVTRRPDWSVPCTFTKAENDVLVTGRGVITGRMEMLDLFDVLIDGTARVERYVRGDCITSAAGYWGVREVANG